MFKMLFKIQLTVWVGTGLLVAGCNSSKKITSRSSTVSSEKQEGYQLVWADEFNRKGPPDTANWRYEHGYVRNEEDQ